MGEEITKIDNLEVKNLTLRSEDGNTSIVLKSLKNMVGLWVGSIGEKVLGTIGIIAQKDQAPYIIIWGKNNKFPALAINTNEDGSLNLQVVDPQNCDDIRHHWAHHVKNVSAEELSKLNIGE